MCGNVGLYGNLTDVDKEMFRTLLVLDTSRGKHGTGIISVKPNFGYTWFKSAGTPGLLHLQDEVHKDNSTDYVPFFDDRGLVVGPSLALIGHNRHATVGKVATETSHPFDFNNVIGVHNGTLRMHSCDLKYKQDFEVDSQVLYANIDESSVPEVFSKVTGAMACVMWDKRNDTLNIWRNEERTLFGVRSLAGDRLMWASEDWMIQDILSVHGQAALWESKVRTWNPDTLFQISMVEGLVAFEQTKMEGKKSAVNFQTPRGRQVTGTAIDFPPATAKGNCIYGKDKADLSQGFFVWTGAAKTFTYVPYVNNKLDLPDTPNLPDGMVCVWDQTIETHQYYFPMDGTVTPGMIEGNFTEEPLLLDNKGSKSENSAVSLATKLDMNGDEAKFIIGTISRVPVEKGDLPTKDWVKVFADKPKGGKGYTHVSFRFGGVTYYCEKSILPYVTYSQSNFWLTKSPTCGGKKLNIIRDLIQPEYRSYKGVGEEPSYEQTAGTDLFDVCGDHLSQDELEKLIDEVGGKCFHCSSVPFTSELKDLTWHYPTKNSCDPYFLCSHCSVFGPTGHQIKRA